MSARRQTTTVRDEREGSDDGRGDGVGGDGGGGGDGARARPDVDKPGPGSWALDMEHCERPRSRWSCDRFAEVYAEGFRRGMERSGSLLETIDIAFVNGFAYISPRPLGAPPDAKGTPPRALFWLLLRLHPALRRRVRRAAEVLETKPWREDVREFFEKTKPARIAKLTALSRIDLEAMDDEPLVRHLAESRRAEQGPDARPLHTRPCRNGAGG